MSEPVIAATQPARLELEPGTYAWCSCGKSDNQPFCNGAHKGTDFKPMSFKIEEKQQVALCQCKYTDTPPYCNSNHENLPEAVSDE